MTGQSKNSKIELLLKTVHTEITGFMHVDTWVWMDFVILLFVTTWLRLFNRARPPKAITFPLNTTDLFEHMDLVSDICCGKVGVSCFVLNGYIHSIISVINPVKQKRLNHSFNNNNNNAV